MMPEITVPMFPQMLKAIEDIVNKQILHTVPQVMEPIMEDLVKTKFPEVIISIFPQVMLPIVEDSVRKVVKEEIQSANEKSLDGRNWTNSNAVTVLGERNVHLEFSEAPDNALTGKEIKGKGGTSIRVAIVDKVTGKIIESGPESTAKVEILLLDASENNDEHNCSHEVFNSRIIKESDKTKPHFAKSYYVYLEKGVGSLCNAKLANGSDWTKGCKCRLGARIVGNLIGVKVQEAWTEPFVVSDSRGQLYAKRYPPSLSDEVWRLDHIGKDGGPCKRLRKNNVSTVEEFRFLLSVDPQRLQDIIGQRNAAWKAIVAHAQTCNIDDKRLFVYSDSSYDNMSVVFDVVGGLKGVITCDSNYVLIDHVPEAEQDCAHKLMLSAFENRKDIKVLSSEMTLVNQFPSRGSYDVPNSSIQGSISQQVEAPESQASACQQMEKSNLATDFGVQDKNLESELNVDQEQVSRGVVGVGSCGHFSPCPSQLFAARNTPIKETSPGYNLINPENINHSEMTMPGTLIQGTSPSIRSSAHPLDCEKHDIPSPTDEVCRLVNICKGGNINQRLHDHKIQTVEDFLIRLLIDPQGLQKIVEMEPEKWSATVKNARACSDKKVYCYEDFQKRAVIVFTILGEDLTLYSWDTTRNTPENNKVETQELLTSAYKNWEAVNRFDDENAFWQHLIEQNKNLDPLNLQVPEPIYGEFGGGGFDMDMADAADDQTTRSCFPQLVDETNRQIYAPQWQLGSASKPNTDGCSKFWDFPEETWDPDFCMDLLNDSPF